MNSTRTPAQYVAALLDQLDNLAAAEKETTTAYAILRDHLLTFTDQHPEIADVVRDAGYPV